MDLKEITDQFLKWENNNKLYDIKINNYPVYSFIRTEIYESLIFGSELNSILKKTSNISTNKINYLKIIQNSLGFFRNHNRIKGSPLVITNTENKIKIESYYVDNFFDKIVNQLSNDTSILEFPNTRNYHFNNILNKGQTVRADIFYVFERLFKSKIDSKEMDDVIIKISNLYFQLYKDIYNIKPSSAKNELRNRIKRNLCRIHLYEKFIRFYKPTKIFLKSAYSPLQQIIIHVAKKNNIEIVELQHGHIYPFHIGYLLPLGNISNTLFPNEILVWSNYYKELLVRNNWKHSKVKVVGDFTYNNELIQKKSPENSNLKEIVNKYDKIITLVSQHTLDKEFIEYLKNINKLPKNALVFVKLHPKYVVSQENNFKSIIKDNENIILVRQGNIKDYLRISDLIVGVYSTGIIEALEMNKTVHLIDTNMSQFFNDLIEKKIVLRSESILSSYQLITNQDNNIEIEFRTKFLGYSI